jgi:hypothetical protein
VREGVFIISELQRKCLLQHIHFQKLMTNLSRKPCQVFTQKLSKTPQNLCQNFLHSCTGLLLIFCASLLYDCLEICANCYSSKLSIKCCTTALENVPKSPKKYHRIFPRFLCKKTSRTDRTDCTKSVQYRLVHSIVLFASIFVPLSFVRTRKSVQYDLFFELYSTSIFVPTFNVVRPAQSIQYDLQ